MERKQDSSSRHRRRLRKRIAKQLVQMKSKETVNVIHGKNNDTASTRDDVTITSPPPVGLQ